MKLGDKLKKNFAKNLQNLRNQNDLTQARLADALNDKYKDYEIDLQRTSIVNYEKEGAMPRIDALYCIAKYFGKTIDQIISSDLEKPVLSYKMLAQEIAAGPVTRVATEEEHEAEQTGPVDVRELEIDKILTTCVIGILNTKFYVEVLGKLHKQLIEDAGSEEGIKKVETMFSKTFLSTLLSKSKYIQDIADVHLNKQQSEIFMAFQDSKATIDMVAKANDLTQEEVISIFNTAQSKIASEIEGNS